MNLDHQKQREIVLKLAYSDLLTFNQLWDKKEDSNKLAYHLNRLVKLGLAKKSKNGYSLTERGKALTAFLDTKGVETTFPTLAYIVLVKNNGRLLCQERLKQPFKTLHSFPSGQVPFGTTAHDAARNGLLEQTGIRVDKLRHKGIEEIKTFEGEQLLYHHILLIFETESTDIQLKQTPKAKNLWLTAKEYLAKKRFPDIALPEIIHSHSFIIASGERYMHNGEFTGAKILNKTVS